MNVENMARQAQAKWGRETQLDMVIEECAELIDVLQKSKRGRRSMQDVVAEGVDVEIMIEQLKVLMEMPALWRNIREEKLTRLQERLSRSG